MDQEVFLMNFRIPSRLKAEFENSCSMLRTNMTAEINRMIRDFVKASKEDLDEPLSWFSTSLDQEEML
jgi:hypothetical protein